MVESDDIVATVQLHQKAALNQEEVGLLWVQSGRGGAFVRSLCQRFHCEARAGTKNRGVHPYVLHESGNTF